MPNPDNREEITSVLLEIFADVLGEKSPAEFEAMTMESEARWDSLALVRIVTAIEDEFEFSIETDEALGLRSFEKCVGFVERKLHQQK